MDKVKDSSRLTGVRAALAKIVQLHHDFPAVLRELGDIESTQSNEKNSLDNQDEVENSRKKLCIGKELDNESISKDYCGMTESLVIEQLRQEAASLDVDVSVAANSLIKAQVKNVITKPKDDANYNRDIKGLCRLVAILSQQGMIQESSLGEQLLQEPAFIRLSLKVLWWFHKAKISSFELILKSIYDSGRTSLSVSTELFSVITYDYQRYQVETFDNEFNDEENKWIQDVMGAVIALAYDLEDREEYVGLRKYAGNILTSITCQVMDFIHEEEKKSTSKNKSDRKTFGKRTHGNDSEENEPIYPLILNWYELILKNTSISNSALEKYLSNQLVQILTHRPELGLGRVLRDQERWRSTQASETLSGLLRKLVVGLGHTSALDTLELVVTNDEVNWGAVLTLVATALNCHQDTANKLKRMIEQYIQRGCGDQDMESLIIGFLFARHACQEGRHIFPPYAQWFLSLFAGESISPANTKPTFVFFVRFLTDLVPHDPAYCLRAHLSNQIFVPRGCQDLIRDYGHLARSRLRDLSETFEPNSRFNQNLEKNKVVEEVENATSSFGKTGKIPKKVIEASIFRKPYFHSSFLPVLLSPRPLPDVPDDKLKLIESLYTSNKLPAAMYKNYFKLCRKEASDLFSGVFTDVQEEIIVDEPINELEAILNELLQLGEKSSDMNEILPILSRVSSKLEELLKFMDTRMKDLTFITIDIRLYNEKGIPYLVCEKFFNILEMICFQKCEPGSIKELQLQICQNKNRPLWLGQFLGLLASSITLQSAFFTLLMYNLKQGQEGSLAVEKTYLYAMILCELHSIDGLFLPVVSSASPENTPENFIKFFIRYLHCSSYEAIEFTTILTGSWLSWYIFINEGKEFDSDEKETENSDSLLYNIINLYVCLAPRFVVMKKFDNKSESSAILKSKESLEEKGSFMMDAMDISEMEMSLAVVYSRLSGLNVPLASQLYYTDQFKKLLLHYQVSFECWIKFELKATWDKTQLSVRQIYLHCRMKQDFMKNKMNDQISSKKSKKSVNKSSSVNSVTMMKEILSVLIDGGMNNIGAGEVVMLLQSLLLESEDCGIFIFEEWIKMLSSNKKSMTQSNNNSKEKYRNYDDLLLSFISLCRCLPSSLFLHPDKLLESVGALQSLIEDLRSANTSCFMNLTDTSYFCSVLLALAGNKKTKSPQLQHYLLTFKHDICFHWDSLQHMFAWEAPKVTKQKCTEDLVSSLSSNNYMSLEVTCASARYISLILIGSEMSISDVCSSSVLLSTMLLYIAQQQIRGKIPMFPTDHTQISIEDDRLLSLCSKELLKQFKTTTFNIAIFLREVLPTRNESKIVHRAVPCAASFIILFAQKNSSMKDSNTSKAHPRMLEMLLSCHELLSFWFENSFDEGLSRDSEVQSRSSHSPSKLSRKSSSNVANVQSLSYIVQLTQQIYLAISKLPIKTFSDLDKNILENADSEIKAAIQKRKIM